jgi:hypothetical protein
MAQSSDGEVVRALDLADGYLTDAEEVLWSVTEGDDTETGDRIADLTEDLWDLQHRLRDIREDIDS